MPLAASLGACQPAGAPASRAAGLDRERLARGYDALILAARPSLLGLGVSALPRGGVWASDPGERFPLQGLVQLIAAAATLAATDARVLTLGERLRVTPDDLGPPPSRLAGLFRADGGAAAFDVPVVDLVSLAVIDADGSACDALLRRLGGPAAADQWLRSRGVEGMRIDRYDRETKVAGAGLAGFDPAWRDEAGWRSAGGAVPAAQREGAIAAFLEDARDTTTLVAALALLTNLAAGQLLSGRSSALLLRLMGASRPGARRLRAGLHAGASLAHASAVSATTLGLTPAAADIGLVTLADGRRAAVAAFLAGSTATEAQRDALFARAGALACASLT
jgi:beta-lactamase class A